MSFLGAGKVQFSNWISSAIDGYFAASAFEQMNFVLTITGFTITLVAALFLASKIKKKISLINNVAGLSTSLATLNEIKRHMRSENWAFLPDRYASLRQTLVEVKYSDHTFTSEQLEIIENALIDVQDLEQQIEKKWKNGLNQKEALAAFLAITKHHDKLNALRMQTSKKVE